MMISHLSVEFLSVSISQDATGTIGQPLNGTCDFSGADIVYTPNTDFCGEDEFTYSVTDSSKEHSDTATVYVNVLCPGSPTRSPTAGDDDVPEPPIANDDEATTNQGSSVVLDVLANDVVPASKFIIHSNAFENNDFVIAKTFS